MKTKPIPAQGLLSRLKPKWTDLAALLLPVFLSLASPPLLPSQTREKPLPARPVATRGPLLPEEQRAISIFEEARASVVYITTLVSRTDFFTLKVFEIPQGTGSGFIWDDGGHIVTNFHVIYEAQNVQVTLSDHSIFKAEVVGTAPDKDLAVLRIKAPKEKLPPIRIGTSSDLKVGQSVYAIGNPFGLDQTLTTGIISALGREIESLTRRPIQGVIQTDAAINPGNSEDLCWTAPAGRSVSTLLSTARPERTPASGLPFPWTP